MNTEPIVVSSQDALDDEAVLRHALEGTPLDPEVAQRVETQADAITERIRRTHGMVDVVQLIRDIRS
jgi:hypothetical protein